MLLSKMNYIAFKIYYFYLIFFTAPHNLCIASVMIYCWSNKDDYENFQTANVKNS